MRRLIVRGRAIAASIAVALALVAPMSAGEDLKSEQKIDAEAKKVLDHCGSYFKAIDSLSVTITTRLSTEALGQNAEQLSSLQLLASRPNRLALNYTTSVQGASQQWTFCCDGARCAGAMLVRRPTKSVARYAIVDTPDVLNELIHNPLVTTALTAATMSSIPGALLSDNPTASVLAGRSSVTCAGREVVDGVECHLIQSVAESTTRNAGRDFDWQVWIECGDRPLIRRSRVTSGKITSKFVALALVANYTDWHVNRPIPNNAFAFERPDSGTREQSFEEVLTGRKLSKATEAHAPHPLVGKPAPEVKLPLLGGGTFELGQSERQDIVLLDFWSTTCIPCIRSLPVVESVVNEFKDRNVRLYAVNVGQTAEEADTFLKKVKWAGKTPVLLDSDLRFAKAYSVEIMPHLVVIDRGGGVHSVRVGKVNDLANELRRELQSLLDCESVEKRRLEPSQQ